jgi:hypothetical protein
MLLSKREGKGKGKGREGKGEEEEEEAAVREKGNVQKNIEFI